MESWGILVISLVSVIVLGCGGGVIIGKYLVKRARSNREPLLSRKERMVYSACVLLGAAFILIGVFYRPDETQNPDLNQDNAIIGDGAGGGMVQDVPSLDNGIVVF